MMNLSTPFYFDPPNHASSSISGRISSPSVAGAMPPSVHRAPGLRNQSPHRLSSPPRQQSHSFLKVASVPSPTLRTLPSTATNPAVAPPVPGKKSQSPHSLVESTITHHMYLYPFVEPSAASLEAFKKHREEMPGFQQSRSLANTEANQADGFYARCSQSYESNFIVASLPSFKD